jgi:8-oxo-dGTP diphosphatase
MAPKFKNIHNKVYHTNQGITKWDSRACAVVCHVWLKQFDSAGNTQTYVLLGKRGDVTDNPGKWNVPCGYLDWNENLYGAMCRELWEETGLDLNELINESSVSINHTRQPWYVYSEPDENRENVAMHMGVVLHVGTSELPDLSLDNMEKNESTEAVWVKLNSALAIKEEDWAFSHYTRLREFVSHVGEFDNI